MSDVTETDRDIHDGEYEEEQGDELEEGTETLDPSPHKLTNGEILIMDRYPDSILGVVVICLNGDVDCECNFHQLLQIVKSEDISTWYITHYDGGPLHCIYHRETEFNLENFCPGCSRIEVEIHKLLHPGCECYECYGATENVTDSSLDTSFESFIPDEDYFPQHF